MLLALLLACDHTLDRQLLPVPAQLRLARDYSPTGGRLGSVHEALLLEVPGYPPLELPGCEDPALDGRREPRAVLWRCGAGPWQAVYLGEEHLLASCAALQGDPPPLAQALPELLGCHPRPEEVLAQAGAGRPQLLLASLDTALSLDEQGQDAWIRATRDLPAADRPALDAALAQPHSATAAWRAVRLGVPVDPQAAATLAARLVREPPGPPRDPALAALLLATPGLSTRGDLACAALEAIPSEPTALDPLVQRDLRAALALVLAQAGTPCAALATAEDRCLAALDCGDHLCTAPELEARVQQALGRPAWELARQPGLTLEDVAAAVVGAPPGARLRTGRLHYAQTPAEPRCSAAPVGAPCACLETPVLLQRAVCADPPAASLRAPGCEATVDDARRTLAGRRTR